MKLWDIIAYKNLHRCSKYVPNDEDPHISKIIMGNKIRKIGRSAFTWYSQNEFFYSVYIDNLENYLSIDFENCQSYPTFSANKLYVNNTLITELKIPEGVKSLSQGLIANNKTITKITIPSSVTSIDNNVFYYCTQLKEINVSMNNSCYSSISGDNF